MRFRTAPELRTAGWINGEPLTLAQLRGRVILLEAFQILCPACVEYGIPQTLRMFERFRATDLAMIGVHTVFEHHDRQGLPEALEAFLRKTPLPFPVAIDAPAAGAAIPQTMQAYRMEGTPTTLLIDRAGQLRMQRLGVEPDDLLIRQIETLLREPAPPQAKSATSRSR